MTRAVLHTTLGDIRVDLFDNHAPKTVANFVGLSDGIRASGPTRGRGEPEPGRCTPTCSSTGSSRAS